LPRLTGPHMRLQLKCVSMVVVNTVLHGCAPNSSVSATAHPVYVRWPGATGGLFLRKEAVGHHKHHNTHTSAVTSPPCDTHCWVSRPRGPAIVIVTLPSRCGVDGCLWWSPVLTPCAHRCCQSRTSAQGLPVPVGHQRWLKPHPAATQHTQLPAASTQVLSPLQVPLRDPPQLRPGGAARHLVLSVTTGHPATTQLPSWASLTQVPPSRPTRSPCLECTWGCSMPPGLHAQLPTSYHPASPGTPLRPTREFTCPQPPPPPPTRTLLLPPVPTHCCSPSAPSPTSHPVWWMRGFELL
jgi:hypothetical protein